MPLSPNAGREAAAADTPSTAIRPRMMARPEPSERPSYMYIERERERGGGGGGRECGGDFELGV